MRDSGVGKDEILKKVIEEVQKEADKAGVSMVTLLLLHMLREIQHLNDKMPTISSIKFFDPLGEDWQ